MTQIQHIIKIQIQNMFKIQIQNIFMTQIQNTFKIQIQMLPGEIQVQGEAANNPSSVEEKPGQQQGSAEEIWLFSF